MNDEQRQIGQAYIQAGHIAYRAALDLGLSEAHVRRVLDQLTFTQLAELIPQRSIEERIVTMRLAGVPIVHVATCVDRSTSWLGYRLHPESHRRKKSYDRKYQQQRRDRVKEERCRELMEVLTRIAKGIEDLKAAVVVAGGRK